MKEREGGLIYPYSDQAQSVVNALLQEVRRRKIKLKCQERVLSIEKKKARFYIKTEGWHYEADRVILTCGGKAAPATGSDGNGYALAKTFGHTVIEPLPALVPLTAKLPFGSLFGRCPEPGKNHPFHRRKSGWRGERRASMDRLWNLRYCRIPAQFPGGPCPSE